MTAWFRPPLFGALAAVLLHFARAQFDPTAAATYALYSAAVRTHAAAWAGSGGAYSPNTGFAPARCDARRRRAGAPRQDCLLRCPSLRDTVPRGALPPRRSCMTARRFDAQAYCDESDVTAWDCNACSQLSGFTVGAYLYDGEYNVAGYVGVDSNSNAIVAFRGTLPEYVFAALRARTRKPCVCD